MFDPKPNHHTHPSTATVGMWLFLASLSMLFAATILGYVVIRIRGAGSAAMGTIQLPRALWLSTAIMLGGSFTIHRAVQAIRLERQLLLRRYLEMTCVLAAAFLCVQGPSLAMLLMEHRRAALQGIALYGLVFFLILVHALHVVGGVIGLGVTTMRARQGRYDHEHYAGVKHAAMYWHFLDVVWVIMFMSMFIAG